MLLATFNIVLSGSLIDSLISFYQGDDDPSWYFTLCRSVGDNFLLKNIFDEVIKINEADGRFKFYTLVNVRHARLLRKFIYKYKQFLDHIATGESSTKSIKTLKTELFDIADSYEDTTELSPDEIDQYDEKLFTGIINVFREWIEPQLVSKKITLNEVDNYIHLQPYGEVRIRMWSLVDIWTLTYKGPVADLGDISKDGQSIHVREVEKNTHDGIHVLSNLEVPKGQQTLNEIYSAFRSTVFGDEYAVNPQSVKMKLKRVMNDMRDWASRDTVMSTTENVYKNVLRGLWTKIKNYEQELRRELVKRLWEESSDSVGMCADGHVGRLINVLIGFDDDFKSKISPMEYFQNNMSLIANNTLAPMAFKVEHARKLMDEIRMPEEERAAWIDAL